MQQLAQLPPRAKAGLAAGFLAVVVVAFLLLRLAGAPSYVTLVSGLDPAETGKVAEALDAQAIPYELQANGTTVAVEKQAVGKARIALAGAGVSAGAGAVDPGFELFDEQKLGASDFQQKVAYQRALEGEIARTIGSVAGVSGAQVQLVLPEDELFADTQTPATAAVLLNGPADALDPAAVRGIAQLTANSVKGLKTSNVTITDGSGRVLWPSGDGAGGVEGGSARMAAEARYETGLESSINAMLARTLGPGKGQVQIKADLDLAKVSRNELRHARRGVPTESTTETERLRGSGARAGGASGVAGNVPSYAGGAAGGGGNSNYQRESETTKYAVDKTVSKVEEPPGRVERLHVALLLDKSVKDVGPIKAAVAAAAGVDAERGDVVETAVLPFAKAPEPPSAGPVPASLVGPAKVAGLGLAALVFLALMLRGLKRREREPLATPAWLTEISEPVRLAELEAAPATAPMQSPAVMLPPRARGESMQKLDQLVDREPERVAAQVKSWMSED